MDVVLDVVLDVVRDVGVFDDDFFFAHTTLSVTGGSGVATAQSGPTPSRNPMGSDATARPLSTGFRDGARGFLADPLPQTACSVIGTAPGVSMQTHPKLPSGPQASLVAYPHARSALLALGLLLGHLVESSPCSIELGVTPPETAGQQVGDLLIGGLHLRGSHVFVHRNGHRVGDGRYGRHRPDHWSSASIGDSGCWSHVFTHRNRRRVGDGRYGRHRHDHWSSPSIGDSEKWVWRGSGGGGGVDVVLDVVRDVGVFDDDGGGGDDDDDVLWVCVWRMVVAVGTRPTSQRVHHQVGRQAFVVPSANSQERPNDSIS